MNGYLSIPVLNTIFTSWISPSDRAIDTGDHAGAALQTTGKFHNHLTFFIEGIKVCLAGIDVETFLAGLAGLLVQVDMVLFVVFEGSRASFSVIFVQLFL